MILSFGDKRTEQFSLGHRERAFEKIETAARIRLDRLQDAVGLSDMAALPGNRFERLRGDREGPYSIRINDQFRICFGWDDEAKGFVNVEIVDYH